MDFFYWVIGGLIIFAAYFLIEWLYDAYMSWPFEG
jgi:hypothetical protein